MKINCLHCGHAFGVDDSYCDYEGLLKCPTCGGLLDARIEDGMIRSVRPGSLRPQAVEEAGPPTPSVSLEPQVLLKQSMAPPFGEAAGNGPSSDQRDVA